MAPQKYSWPTYFMWLTYMYTQIKHVFVLNCQVNVYSYCTFIFSEIIDHTPRTPIPRSLSYRTLQKHFRLCDVCEFARSGIEVWRFNHYIFLVTFGQILLLVLTVFLPLFHRRSCLKNKFKHLQIILFEIFFSSKIVFAFQLSSMSCFI